MWTRTCRPAADDLAPINFCFGESRHAHQPSLEERGGLRAESWVADRRRGAATRPRCAPTTSLRRADHESPGRDVEQGIAKFSRFRQLAAFLRRRCFRADSDEMPQQSV